VKLSLGCSIIPVARRWRRSPSSARRRCWLRSSIASTIASIDYRQQLVAEAHRVLRPGGVFVVVEKLLGRTARLTSSFDSTYLAMKSRNGYGPDEIDRKRLSLEGVLQRVTAEWNEDTLTAAGFRHFDCVWRWCNFAAWVAYKGDE
jgi:tRNA (cmo5U34)-methyltransferase